MYSRSYGIAESEGAKTIAVPPDYNGSMYPRRPVQEPRKAIEEARPSADIQTAVSPAQEPKKAEVSPPEQAASENGTKPRDGLLGGLFDKLSVDDLLMFGLLFLLLTGETERSTSLFPVLLAVLLI